MSWGFFWLLLLLLLFEISTPTIFPENVNLLIENPQSICNMTGVDNNDALVCVGLRARVFVCVSGGL